MSGGFLSWDRWYSQEQTIHAERAAADFDMMEIQLYALIKFAADTKLTPKTVTEFAGLLDAVQNIRHKLRRDVEYSRQQAKEATKARP